MNIKKLKKIYEEYKKIGQPKDYVDGGLVSGGSYQPFSGQEADKLFGVSPPAPGMEALATPASQTSADPSQLSSGNLPLPNPSDIFEPGATANAVPSQATMDQYSDNALNQSNTDSNISQPDSSGGPMSFLSSILGSGGSGSKQQPTTDPNAAQNAAISQNLGKYYSSLGHYKGGKIKGYDDGGEVEPGYHEVDDSENPMIQKYKDLGMLSGKTIASDEPDEALVTGKPSSDDLSEDNTSSEESKDDEDLKNYKEEDEDAKKTVDSKKALEDELDKEIEDSVKDESKDKEHENNLEPSNDEKQDIANNGFTTKTEGIGSPEELAKAQRQRQMAINQNTQLQLGNLIGAGIAGRGGAQVNPLPASYFQSLNAGANLPVQNIQEQLANQQNDPNSPVSKVVGQYLTNKGFNLPPGTSASDAMKVMPFLQKDQALQNAIQKVIMQQGGAQKRAELTNTTKADIAEKNRQAAMERQRVANEGKVASAKAGAEAKAGKEQRDAAVKAENDLNSTRGKQALQLAQRNLMSVKNAQKMFEEFPDPNKWTPSQVALFNTEMSKIASGGAPTEGMLKELSNPTAASSIASFASKIANVPVGAQQGKFINLNKKYLQGLGDVSQQTIKDNMGNVIKSYEDKLGPDQYKNLLYRHSDMLGLFTPKQEKGITAVMQAKGLSRQDAIKGLVQQGALKDLSY